MKVIIYNQDNNEGVMVLVPTPEILKTKTVYEVAVKDVPVGRPFAIVDVEDLPNDVPQEYWVVDDADLKDGVGGESNEF